MKMESVLQILLVLLFALWTHSGLALSYGSPPPPFKVVGVETQNQFIRIDNTRETIEVRAADTFDLLWEIKARRHYKRGADIHLSWGGKYLFYILPSVMIRSLDSTVLEVYSRDGFVTEYKVKDVLDSLPEVENPCGGCSTHYWRAGGYKAHVNKSGIRVRIVGGADANFRGDEQKVIIQQLLE